MASCWTVVTAWHSPSSVPSIWARSWFHSFPKRCITSRLASHHSHSLPVTEYPSDSRGPHSTSEAMCLSTRWSTSMSSSSSTHALPYPMVAS